MTAGLFSVGDYRLRIDTTADGADAPAVVLVPGTEDTSADGFGEVLPHLRDVPLVCYSRPGLGDSEPAAVTTPRGVRAAAGELHTLLEAAEIHPPWVLVGHSFGGLICEAFAAEWPDETAGLVLIDTSDAQLYLDVGRPVVGDGEEPGTIPFDVAASVRDLARHGAHTPERPVAVVASRPGRWLDSKTPELWRPFTLAELDDRWQANQAALAERLGGGLIKAQTGGHYVQRDDPELVASAIRHICQQVSLRRQHGAHDRDQTSQPTSGQANSSRMTS
ncbi:MAG: alpha/beta fold hydrolase [Nocardioides sp.]|uniref:alpha/beta fold hydrolase n=1 Tax=Nocardioides sp. TaxID=35761 RepID=UPI003D6C096D